MSLLVVKCINNLVMSLAIIFTVMYLNNEKIKLLSGKTIFWIFVSLLPCFVFNDPGYNIIFTVFSFLCMILLVNNLFNITVMSSFVIVIYFIIFSSIPDLIASSIVIHFLNYSQLLDNLLLVSVINLLISISTYCLFRIPFIKKLTNYSMMKTNKTKYRNIILYVVLSFISIGIAYYSITDIFKPTHTYYIVNLLALFLIILIFIYMSELIKYNQLEDKNAILYECMKNIEGYQEEQDLKIHEYKNQLSKIIAVTNDKKIINMLEEILDVDLTADTYLLGKLKNIPKGELKSLIYYKLLVASRDKIKLYINISKEVNIDKNISKKQYKCLSYLLGIYFDNAIEATKKSKEKKLYFEIYTSSVGLVFMISNTFAENINVEMIGTKGYTTKGNNHGKGLYLAKKLLNKKNNILLRTAIDNNVFTQKIIIKKE